MLKKDAIDFCTHFYNCTNIPLQYYENSVLQLQLPLIETNQDPFAKYYELLMNQPKPTTYTVTKQFVYYGIVKDQENTNSSILLGPITNIAYSKEILKEVLLDASPSLKSTPLISDIFNTFPLIGFERFLQTLCFIHYIINHISLTLDEVLDYKNQKILLPIATEYTLKTYTAKEDQHFHNSHQFEKQYLSIIENGDLASLKKITESPIVITPGIMADNSIRQVKNLFVATTTLVTRAAIKGGVDMECAYQLSDVYIQQMEKLQSLETIYNLQYQMVLDYTERVFAAKIPSGISLVVYECINYINANTNQPITVTDVAKSVKKSRSFISHKFMQELGFGINDFINSRKMEEAKYLLTYSTKSISEISFYLCFSSQSYFQNVFKKKLGITPNNYRLKKSSNRDVY